MDRSEAASVLNFVMARWRRLHGDLLPFVGTDESEEIAGETCVHYVVNIEIEYVNEDDSSIEVAGIITERGGWRLLPDRSLVSLVFALMAAGRSR